jgi:hypothetical protein
LGDTPLHIFDRVMARLKEKKEARVKASGRTTRPQRTKAAADLGRQVKKGFPAATDVEEDEDSSPELVYETSTNIDGSEELQSEGEEWDRGSDTHVDRRQRAIRNRTSQLAPLSQA